jgi:ABC-type branched-subunit amino acid transport system substrate-binding protein
LSEALRLCVFAIMTLALASCGGMDVGGLFNDSGPQPQQPQLQTQPQVPAQNATVALLLPLSAQGEVGEIGKAMKQAAELALFDAGQSGITLVTKDTRGAPDGAQAAAQAALAEGAQLILGPLLSSEVQAVSPIAAGRNVPVVAFSSVVGVAGQGTYLMSFLPAEEVANIIRYSSTSGIRNIAALMPNSQYGAAVQAALDEATKQYGVRVVASERYTRSAAALARPAQSIAQAVNDPGRGIQALFIPEGGELLGGISAQLMQYGLSPNSVRVLGTGLWDDPASSRVPIAQGGWFAGVLSQSLSQFEQRYQQTYGASPHRLASLAYDATSLAIILARNGQGYTAESITNPEGFQGVNGLFRFRADGRIQRGLSILSVSPGGNTVVAPAPSRFGNGF